MSRDVIYQRSPKWLQTLLLNAYAVGISRYRRGARLHRALEELMTSQYWSRDRLNAYQDERLRQIVRVAYTSSAYYRRLMVDRKLTPDDIRGAPDLSKLPLLTKEALRDHLADILTAAKPRREWRHGHTSGTTGSPLSLWYDRPTSVVNEAVDIAASLYAKAR